MVQHSSRRSFLQSVGWGSVGALAAASVLNSETRAVAAPDERILGVDGVKTAKRATEKWEPISDRKLRVGIVGYGVCQFGAAFGFQDHPNVTVAAISDLREEQRGNKGDIPECH